MEHENVKFSGFVMRWAIVRDRGKGTSARCFAAAEIVLLPLSFVTFVYVLVSAALTLFGLDAASWLPTWFSKWMLPMP